MKIISKYFPIQSSSIGKISSVLFSSSACTDIAEFINELHVTISTARKVRGTFITALHISADSATGMTSMNHITGCVNRWLATSMSKCSLPHLAVLPDILSTNFL
jgi:hypothetical protein